MVRTLFQLSTLQILWQFDKIAEEKFCFLPQELQHHLLHTFMRYELRCAHEDIIARPDYMHSYDTRAGGEF